MRKTDLQPTDGAQPDHVTLDGTVIHLTDQRYWLYAAVDPKANDFHHIRPLSTGSKGITSIFLSELTENREINDAVILVDSGPWLKVTLQRHGLRFRHETRGNLNAVERVFQEVNRQTYQFLNVLRNAEPNTAEPWFQSDAYVRISYSERGLPEQRIHGRNVPRGSPSK